MKIAADQKRFYKAVRATLIQILAEAIEAEDYQLEALTAPGISADLARYQRVHPGRVEMLDELIPEVLDPAFGFKEDENNGK